MSDASPPPLSEKAQPGEWNLRLHHKCIGGVRNFISKYEPHIRSHPSGTTLTIVIDENLYVMPVEGLMFIWKVYIHRDGEEPPLANVWELTAPTFADQPDRESGSADPIERIQPSVGRHGKTVSG